MSRRGPGDPGKLSRGTGSTPLRVTYAFKGVQRHMVQVTSCIGLSRVRPEKKSPYLPRSRVFSFHPSQSILPRTGDMASSLTDEQLMAYAELPRQGRYMAEVFAVRIPAIAGGDLPSGTISFHGGHYCSDFIYSWSPTEEDISRKTCDSQGNIVLTGPSVATSAYSPIVFSLDLQDSSHVQADGEEEVEENTGRIVCDAVGGDFSEYNRVISETVRTAYGPAEVIYAVLSNAVQALVEVKLAGMQSGDDEEDGAFLGKIVARSKLFDVSCVLFQHNEADKGVHVRPGELVPLARQALAVPLHMPLTIELDLHRSSGDEIVRGQLEFKTAIDGLHTKRLVGANGAEFEVTIVWSEYPW